MNRIKKEKIKSLNNKELFSYLENYLKKIISEDLNHIYGKDVHLLDREEPWVFRLSK